MRVVWRRITTKKTILFLWGGVDLSLLFLPYTDLTVEDLAIQQRARQIKTDRSIKIILMITKSRENRHGIEER